MIIRGLEAAANGMQALINQNDSTANNIANANTMGYKRQMLVFKNIYDSNIVQQDANGGDVKNIGELSVGCQVQKLTYDFSQGVLTKTENIFDVAIEGDGFFKVQSPDGEVSYTRNGSFILNNNGNLVTKDGDYVLDGNGTPIKIKANDVVMRSLNDIIITSDGQIELNGQDDQVMLQKIGVFDFTNKENMNYIGGAKFKPSDASMQEVRPVNFKIQQGTLETSNANIVNEMIKTISTSRNYETLSKLVKADGDSLSNVMTVGRL